MKQLLKYMKPFDYVFITLALVLSFLPAIVTAVSQSMAPQVETIAIIKINGVEVDRFGLFEGAEKIETTYYPNDGQYNIVERDGDRIRIKEDNSPDQIGVRTGWISKPGQTAICLPHNFVIEIQGKEEADELILPI